MRKGNPQYLHRSKRRSLSLSRVTALRDGAQQVPQFLVTFLSAIIFYLLEPTRPTLPEHHTSPHVPVKGNITLTDETEGFDPLEGELSMGGGARLLARAAVHALFHDKSSRELEAHVTSGTDSVGLVFR